MLGSSTGLDAVARLRGLAAGPFSGCELRVDPEDTGWIGAAAATGWLDGGVRERWAGPLSARPIDPDFASLGELGEGAFIALLNAATEGDSPVRLEDYRPLQPGELDMWGSVGPAVLLPRLIEPELGALLYIGIPKALRGGGWGRRAHDSALGSLHRAGARRYEDETDALNLPMLRLFARAGMERVGRWRRLLRG